MIELRAGPAMCVVSPIDGGRLAALRIDGQPLLVERNVQASTQDPMTWGSFPMVPYAGRVREGRFEFAGAAHQLPIGLAPHAIHGTVYTVAWDVTATTATTIDMRSELGDYWPFGGWSGQRIDLSADRVVCELWVTAADRSMPAMVGWHPWFVKPRSAMLRFARQYERGDDGLPTGRLVEPVPHPWDDCFVEPLEPLRLRIGDIDVTIASDCDHWVVFDMPAEATCVEPQSGPPDSFNGRPTTLDPGRTLRRSMTISWK